MPKAVFCVSGQYICAGVNGLIVIGSDHLIWIGRGFEMEESAQVDVGSEANHWWTIHQENALCPQDILGWLKVL